MIYTKSENTGEEQLYITSMGKIIRVSCIAESVDEANEYCANHDDVGVICEWGTSVVVADFDSAKFSSK